MALKRSREIQHVDLELAIDGCHMLIRESGSEPRLESRPKVFPFRLRREDAVYGNVELPHYWIDQRGVYGDRKRSQSLHRKLVDCFWAICMREGAVFDEGPQESYILANLLPYARSNGSRRVFVDALPAPEEKWPKNRKELICNLDTLLKSSPSKMMTLTEFHDDTANAIGPLRYEEDVWSLYRNFQAELLVQGRERLEKEGPSGVEATRQLWVNWMNSISRRAGHQKEKQILDIFSYECRAALHRCYSAVWEEILKYLKSDYDLPFQSALFHKFWHQDQNFGSDHPQDSYYHIFHGHIFSLHPASGNFILTPTGQKLIGDWLSESQNGRSFGRLLYGLAVAVHDYAIRHEVHSELRKKQPESAPGGDMERVQEEELDKKSGWRREK